MLPNILDPVHPVVSTKDALDNLQGLRPNSGGISIGRHINDLCFYHPLAKISSANVWLSSARHLVSMGVSKFPRDRPAGRFSWTNVPEDMILDIRINLSQSAARPSASSFEVAKPADLETKPRSSRTEYHRFQAPSSSPKANLYEWLDQESVRTMEDNRSYFFKM